MQLFGCAGTNMLDLPLTRKSSLSFAATKQDRRVPRFEEELHAMNELARPMYGVPYLKEHTYIHTYVHTYILKAFCQWWLPTIPVQPRHETSFLQQSQLFQLLYLWCCFTLGLLVLCCGTQSCNRFPTPQRRGVTTTLQHPNIPNRPAFQLSKMFGTKPHSQQDQHAFCFVFSTAHDGAVMGIRSRNTAVCRGERQIAWPIWSANASA